ncbi:MAG: hypothetical protein RIB67_07145 [Miltoncostaeaceae bacterium]
MSDGSHTRGRPVRPAAYAALGAVAFLVALAVVGAASVSLQLDGWGWRALGVALAAGSIGLLVVAVRALLRGRLHRGDDRGGRA